MTRAGSSGPWLGLALWGALALLGAPARAQAPAPSPDAALALLPDIHQGAGPLLREDDAVAEALAASHDLAIKQGEIAIASARRDAASAFENPELRIEDLSTEYVRDRVDKLGVGLRWRPPALGERQETRLTEEEKVWQRRMEAHEARQDLMARTRREYAWLVRLEQVSLLRRERLDVETKRVELIARMKDLGRRSIVYYTKARMRLGQSRTELSRLEQARSESRRTLARLVGRAPDAPFRVEPGAEVDLVLTPEQLVSVATSHGLEPELVRQRAALAQARLERARLRVLPWFSFVEIGYHAEWRDPDWLELRLGLDLPLFDWGRDSRLAAEMAVARKETQAEALLERMEQRVRERYTVYRDAFMDWQLSARELRTLIDETRAVIAQAKRSTSVPADEVLELELTVLEAREILCDKRYALAVARIDLLERLGITGLSELGAP